MKDFEIRCDKSRLEKNNILYGKFSLGPFLPGQGTTLGNALRRSLLSELSGLAITAFEIVGVMQEFSTLPGLRESVLDLSLNLKQVVLTGTLPCSTTPIGFLNVRGPAKIKATDLKLPSGIYCASPEQYIATLDSTGTLNLKFIVSVGKGHSTQPYALYRSLSKIKLKPIDSLNSVGKSAHNESETFSDPSFDLLHSASSKGIRPHNFEALSKGATSQRSTDKKSINSFNKIESPNLEIKPSDSKNNNRQLSPLQGGSSINFINNSNLADFKGQEAQASLELPQRGIIANNMDNRNNIISEYISIQKQIFQRVNPHQVLSIDAVFTPVFKVNFSIKMNDRFETARENIVLEIWTNGSIHPKRALEEATLSLTQNFQALLQNIQQASSFYKGLRYWNSLQPLNSYGQAIKLPNSVDKADLSSENSLNSSQHPRYPSSFTPPGLAEWSESKEVAPMSVKKNIDKNYDLLSTEKVKALYNLDVGNLNFSLQTFIQLKKAKINNLSQLLNNFILKDKKVLFNEKTVFEIKHVFKKLGINL